MTSTFSVRRARPEDAAEITRLSVQLDPDLDPATLAQRFIRLVERPTHAFFVLEMTNRIVGFSAANTRSLLQLGERVELIAMVVDADLQRRRRRRAGGGHGGMGGKAWRRRHGGTLGLFARRVASVLSTHRIHAPQNPARLHTVTHAMKRYAVFGHPVLHSLSPKIHQAFAKQSGIAMDYLAIECAPGDFPGTLSSFARSGGDGGNVGPLPHKQRAAELCNLLSARAKHAGAVIAMSAAPARWATTPTAPVWCAISPAATAWICADGAH